MAAGWQFVCMLLCGSGLHADAGSFKLTANCRRQLLECSAPGSCMTDHSLDLNWGIASLKEASLDYSNSQSEVAGIGTR